MIDAAIVGLGRWGKSLVSAIQGRSARLRFVHGVSQEPDEVRLIVVEPGQLRVNESWRGLAVPCTPTGSCLANRGSV